MNGSTGHSTNSEVSVTVKVTMPHGSRIPSYSTVRHATGSFSAIHTRCTSPPPLRHGNGLGSSIRTPSSRRARPRSNFPISRAPINASASSGKPTTVMVSPALRTSVVAT